MIADSGLDLRQLRTFAVVADRRSFTRAADDLHIAQQAVSQQIKALERSLGVTLLRRSSRQVELTAEGAMFLTDSVRLLEAADRAARRVKAAARGEAGTLRLAYTLTTAWDTVPHVLARLSAVYPQLKLAAREVYGADIPALLSTDQCDIALAPMTRYPKGFRTRTIRREHLRIAISDEDPILATGGPVDLSVIQARQFELWPREMAPGFYDAVIGACRAAGFEPELDEHAGGSTVWGYLARGRGVALINDSLKEQLPRGIALVALASPPATITFQVVWRHAERQAVQRVLDATAALAKERHWI